MPYLLHIRNICKHQVRESAVDLGPRVKTKILEKPTGNSSVDAYNKPYDIELLVGYSVAKGVDKMQLCFMF
jgi:hypothetical protein